MRKNDKLIQTCFQEWLIENKERFTHPPVLSTEAPDEDIYYYDGIIHKITLVIRKGGVNVVVTHQEELWDFIYDDDLIIKKKKHKYFCELCEDYDKKNTKFYPAPGNLIEEHCFEPLLEWRNKNILAANFLLLVWNKHHSTWAEIIRGADKANKADYETRYKKDSELYFIMLPLRV